MRGGSIFPWPRRAGAAVGLPARRSITRHFLTGHITALEKHFPAGARWRRPAAGVFVWVELPDGFDAGEVLRVALEQERGAFVPGHAFAADGSRAGSHCMRLNFSHSTPEMIDEAVARLGRALQTVAP